MPQADRDAFLSWWDYIIKEREFKRKSRIILDSHPLKSTHLRDIARKQCPADFFNK